MQVPNAKTPIPRCVMLAFYASRMMSNFTDNPQLVAFGQQLLAAGTELDTAQTKYTDAVKQIVFARVDLKYINHIADDGLRMAMRRAEMADGKVGGVLASKLYPDGVTPIAKPFGKAQVAAMVDLETRYEKVAKAWPDAPKEQAIIADLRTQYDDRITAREQAKKNAHDLKVARDMVKDDFLTLYAQIAAGVKVEFPRDRKMQDLFFDEIETDDESDTAAPGEPAVGDKGAPAVPPPVANNTAPDKPQ